MTRDATRLRALDGMRALSAMMVVVFHYTYRWTEAWDAESALLPQVEPWSSMASRGFIGVQLFFMVSGFVVAFTLSRSGGIWEFAVKRFARLFPAMLCCSIVTFLVVKGLGVEPFASVNASGFLPSLTFTSPAIIRRLTGLQTAYISGVYWSLFVEVKFYAIAVLIYFAQPRWFLRNFAIVCVLLGVAWWGSAQSVRSILEQLTFVENAAFFAAGIAFNHAYHSGFGLASGSVTAVSLAVAIAQYRYDAWLVAVIVGAFGMFCVLAVKPVWLRPLEARPLVAIGAASYSLYLMHQNVGVAVLSGVSRSAEYHLYLVAMCAAMVGVSLVLHRWVEVPARLAIVVWSRVSSTAGRPRVSCGATLGGP